MYYYRIMESTETIMNLGVNMAMNLTMHSVQTMRTVNKKLGIEVNGRMNMVKDMKRNLGSKRERVQIWTQ
jgi:hypothetical protein